VLGLELLSWWLVRCAHIFIQLSVVITPYDAVTHFAHERRRCHSPGQAVIPNSLHQLKVSANIIDARSPLADQKSTDIYVAWTPFCHFAACPFLSLVELSHFVCQRCPGTWCVVW